MASLHVLRRTDTQIIQVACSDDAVAYAAALSKDQAFEVEVLAVLNGAGGLLEAVQRDLGPSVKGAWYNKGLGEVLASVVEALESEDSLPVEDEERPPKRQRPAQEELEAQPEPRQPTTLPAALAEHLEICRSSEAPKALEVIRALKQRLSTEAAHALLKDLHQVSVSDAAGHKRRILKPASCARGEALRLRALVSDAPL
jgi:hypothetical protein